MTKLHLNGAVYKFNVDFVIDSLLTLYNSTLQETAQKE